MHVCPKVNPGPVPHVGGPVALGSTSVLIGNIPAARVGDMAICVGPPDKITTGSSGVLINGKAAARLGDSTAHGGKIVVGYPTVLIGGGGGGGGADTVGSTLGNPSAGLTAFNNLAKTRVSGATQQSYGNCGVESARQIMDVASNARNEIDVLQDAINNGNAGYDPDPTQVGGTSPQGRQNILKNNGVNSHLENQTVGNIQQAVIEGKGVITSHAARVLWGDRRVSGNHAVLTTGVKYDASGKVSHYVINDTGTGQGMRNVPATQYENSLIPNRQINVTDNPIW
ncbi:MAG TPA: PAAR domain-containing protein [Gammaproteobacteria bacterium]